MWLKSFIKPVILLLCISFMTTCSVQKGRPGSRDSAIGTLEFSKFLDPPSEFRSHPFYSINDSLTEEEITRQIIDFKNAGFGGFYLHSRSGLITEFLGDNWWKIMQASVDAAKAAGLQCMFYDEDKWPSGFSGGIIPRMDESYRSKCLARLDKSTPLPKGAVIIKQDSRYNYVLYTMQFGYDIFNGTCYVDLFNPEVVKAFIDVSYKPYVDKYNPAGMKYTPAFFTDEPHIHARYFDRKTPHLGTLSYSPWLEKKFETMYGYSLRENLDLLYEEKENWREVRMHYYRAKALLFEESFTRQIAGYCGENGMVFTGHYLGEDVLEKVRDRIGNSMLHYRSMQQPGIDHLGLTIKSRTITARRMSSVANQFGREKRLSELFGISGQNMNFQDRKWLAGWHSILGINHFCPHLTLYSMKGARKRDYPPTFSYQQPYWGYNKKMEDYLGRIAYAASVGKYDPQILVISPLESEYIKGKDDGEFTSGMLKVLDRLQALHYDYDIGDEQILADTAFVKGDRLVVGAMGYKHIVLPDMISIRQSTLDLISELQKKGGKVFSTGRFPRFVDGKEGGTALDEIKKSVINADPEKLKATLYNYVEPNVDIEGKGSEKIWSQTRIVKGGKLVQLANTSHTEAIRFDLSVDFTGGDVVLWDPSEAKCYRLKKNGAGKYAIELAASSNIWITFGKLSNGAVIAGEYKLPGETEEILVLDKKWKGKRLSPNAITLDFASYSTDNGKTFTTPEPVIGIFNRLADHNYNGKLILEYMVEIEKVPGNCNLVAEQPEMFSRIVINGKDFRFGADGFYVDRTFLTTDISDHIINGKNTIRLELDFRAPIPLSADPKERYGTEIESIYLTGDFGVSAKRAGDTMDTQRNRTGDFQQRPVHRFTSFAIGEEKTDFDGNLTLEGYPFYAGAFELSQWFEINNPDKTKRYFFELPNCEAIVSVVEINGQVADTLVWAPFKTEITDFMVEGKNELKITLVNSLRNLLGPHHHRGGELVKVGPNSFTGAGGFPDGRGEKDWYNIRKTGSENAIWTDVYHHIPFGFIEPVIITTSKKQN